MRVRVGEGEGEGVGVGARVCVAGGEEGRAGPCAKMKAEATRAPTPSSISFRLSDEPPLPRPLPRHSLLLEP